jgi:DNA mismatch repair protein MutS2
VTAPTPPAQMPPAESPPARSHDSLASHAQSDLSQLQKTASELEWPRLLERIARFCHSGVGANALLGLMPEEQFGLGRARMERTAEVMALAKLAPLPAARLEDQEQALAQLARGLSLDGKELRALALTLEQSEKLRQYLERHVEAAPLLGVWLATSPALARLEQTIVRSIGPDGAILDEASPGLARARQRALGERDDLRQRLTQLLGRLAPALQGQYLAERDGRFVLPVRADAPFKVDGLVLGSSASGSTLYVEPRETHDLGNRVQLAEAAVRVEEARVLAALNAEVSAQLDAVRRAQEVCIEADVLRALARYADETRSLALLPEPEARLDLKQMRHPLLLGNEREVVANDLSIEAGRGVILSGPNAGGKTVALECFGLAAWMARSGIPLPVAPRSSVGWFDEVLTEIGNHQSLIHSLSTFSAHIVQVREALQRASRGTLVLVDELAGGTDPDEGAALAVAIVEALVARGAAVCVTTHHDRLKAFAAEHPGLTNAAVGFDRSRLAPTFAIEQGAPGASSAFLMAERFGIDAQIVARAAAVLPESVLAQRALAEELSSQRERLARATSELDVERQQLATLQHELEGERRRRLQEERGKLSQETQSVLDEVQRARVRLRDAEARLGASGSSALSEARRAVNELARFVSIGGELREIAAALDPAPRPVTQPLSWERLAIGATVTLPAMGATGTVVAKPRRDRVTLAIGNMKTTVGIEALSAASGPLDPGGKATPPATPGSRSRRGERRSPSSVDDAPAGGEPMRTRDNTLSLVGERVEPALERLDVFIDGLVRRGEPLGFVVHGHGTGALRNAVRERLRQHPNVRQSRPAAPDDGGDALTVYWIR